MFEPNVASWTAMIDAYSGDGYGEKALKLFYEMQCKGVQQTDTRLPLFSLPVQTRKVLETARRSMKK